MSESAPNIDSGLQHLELRLARYLAHHPADPVASAIIAFARDHENCLWRECLTGHITASAWVIDASREHALLHHHRKLDRWLQLGGHVDGEGKVEDAALREVEEESGLSTLRIISAALQPHPDSDNKPPVPLDLDIHPIPARDHEPGHDHLDIRYLIVAEGKEPLAISEESLALEWIPIHRLEDYTDEESVLRLNRRAQAWL